MVDGCGWRIPAFRHGIAEADILHAFRIAVRLVEVEQHGEERLIVIGPDRAGNWLELVAVPAEDADRIIHADRLRPMFYEFLR